MSENKTQLQTNNARLASLITELEGKAAGGGGSVETCTVEVRSTALPADICYVDAETQEAVWWTAEGPGDYPQPFKVQNKSIVFVRGGSNITVSGGNLLISLVYFVSPGAGGTCIIE